MRLLERFTSKSKYIGSASALFLFLSIVFLFVYFAIAETKKSLISVALEGIFSEAALIKHLDENVDFDISPVFPLKLERGRVEHKTLIEEMSKSAPVWKKEKLSRKKVCEEVFYLGAIDGSLKKEYELIEEYSCIKAIIPLKDEGRALFISSPQEELFDYLALLDRYSTATIVLMLFISALLCYFIYFLYVFREKKEELEDSFKKKSKHIEELAMIDKLTGVYSRRKFEEAMNESLYIAKNFKHTFSVIMIDIDDFKSVNDTYGHDGGDSVLKGAASFIQANMRTSDTFARWGGEEFVVISFMQDLPQAVRFANRLREGISNIHFPKIGRVTCSFGVAEYDGISEGDTILKLADERLYEAKKAGKNRVEPKF